MSYLLELGYTPQEPFSRAAVLVYAAKKRAEIAPGVGANTDGFGIGDRYYFPVEDETRDQLQAAFRTIRDGEQAALAAAILGFDEYVRRCPLGKPSATGAAACRQAVGQGRVVELARAAIDRPAEEG